MKKCNHPAPAIVFDDETGFVACVDCGSTRHLTETEQARRVAAIAGFEQFAAEHGASTGRFSKVSANGDAIWFIGSLPDDRTFAIGFRFDNAEPFPRPGPFWPPDVKVPLRAVRHA